MLSYNESLKILKETNALLEGHFVLSSGLHSAQYVQCAQLLSYPNKAQKICISLAQKISKDFKKIDFILSPAMGGIVIGYEIAKLLNVRGIFAEREEGNMVLRRGFDLPKKSRVLILEDVITTGKSAKECSAIVKASNSVLLGYACIIDRSDENLSIKDKIISQIKIKIKLFKKNNLPNYLKKTPPTKPGSRKIL